MFCALLPGQTEMLLNAAKMMERPARLRNTQLVLMEWSVYEFKYSLSRLLVLRCVAPDRRLLLSSRLFQRDRHAFG